MGSQWSTTLPTGRREMSKLWVFSLVLGLAYAQVHSNDSGLENNQLQATPRFLQRAFTPGSIFIYIVVLVIIAFYQLSLPMCLAGQEFLIESLFSFVPDIKFRNDKKATSRVLHGPVGLSAILEYLVTSNMRI